mmetsp:Transcript_63727/g.170752  ORF Transcript_63727/g.170752 Transcript_63727/m.170752 type:complete len:210 (+) Transcript_63727:196-825(+)
MGTVFVSGRQRQLRWKRSTRQAIRHYDCGMPNSTRHFTLHCCNPPLSSIFILNLGTPLSGVAAVGRLVLMPSVYTCRSLPGSTASLENTTLLSCKRPLCRGGTPPVPLFSSAAAEHGPSFSPIPSGAPACRSPGPRQNCCCLVFNLALPRTAQSAGVTPGPCAQPLLLLAARPCAAPTVRPGVLRRSWGGGVLSSVRRIAIGTVFVSRW